MVISPTSPPRLSKKKAVLQLNCVNRQQSMLSTVNTILPPPPRLHPLNPTDSNPVEIETLSPLHPNQNPGGGEGEKMFIFRLIY